MEKRVVLERRGGGEDAKAKRRASSQPPRAISTLDEAVGAALSASAVFDACDAGVVVFDAAGNCAYANSASVTLLGATTAAQLVGRPGLGTLSELVHVVIETNEAVREPQVAIPRLNGFGEAWVELSVQPSAGGAVATLIDVESRRTADSESAFRKTLLQAQSDASLDAILVVSPSSKFISYNRRFIEMWGVSDAIVASGSDQDALEMVLTKVVDPAGFFSRVQHLYDNPDEESRDQIDLRDGRVVDRYSAPVRDASGKHHGRVWFFRDVTARAHVEKEREQLLASAEAARSAAEEANRTKDQFLAVVSHELRTPLNAILGWARISRRPGRTESDREKATQIIERNALVQARLIEDLLDVSRVVTGKIRLNVGRVELGAIVAYTVDAVQPAAAAKGIDLVMNVEAPRALTTGDHERLQQVAYNLVTNAIKFTPEGGRVGVNLTRSASVAELIVEDNGIGIDPCFLPYVFERFRQADDSPTTRNHGGLGLGLSIAKHIIELHGGSIAAESEGKGKGSRFTVRLPIRALTSTGNQEAARQPRSSPPSAPPGPLPDLDGVRILFVDDEADARDLLVDLLGGCGARVVAAGSADEALSALDAGSFDVLVSDISMPDKDGYSLLEALRALEKERYLRELPAIALTAMTSEAARERAHRVGFGALVTKPAEPFELVHAVARAVGRSPAYVVDDTLMPASTQTAPT